MSQFKIKLNIFLPLWILFILVEFVQSLKVNRNHLMCLEKSDKCVGHLDKLLRLSRKRKNGIFTLVNEIRIKAISGELKFSNYASLTEHSSRSGLGEMRWDTTLEETAQAKANQCAFERSNPSILKIGNFEIGEMISLHDSNMVKESSYFLQMIQDFKSERWNFDVNNHFKDARDRIIQGNLENRSYFGNLVELLKDEYYLIGCGFSKMNEQDKILNVCHLGPQRTGNSKPLWSENNCQQNFGSGSSKSENGLCTTTRMPNAATLLKLGTRSLKDAICYGTSTGSSRGVGGFCISLSFVIGTGLIFYIAMLRFYK